MDVLERIERNMPEGWEHVDPDFAELLRLAKLGRAAEKLCADCEDDLRHKELLEVCASCRFKPIKTLREVK
jgi:hypothetical protein